MCEHDTWKLIFRSNGFLKDFSALSSGLSEQLTRIYFARNGQKKRSYHLYGPLSLSVWWLWLPQYRDDLLQSFMLRFPRHCCSEFKLFCFVGNCTRCFIRFDFVIPFQTVWWENSDDEKINRSLKLTTKDGEIEIVFFFSSLGLIEFFSVPFSVLQIHLRFVHGLFIGYLGNLS